MSKGRVGSKFKKLKSVGMNVVVLFIHLHSKFQSSLSCCHPVLDPGAFRN